jgi:filamentous hemagglutinin
VRSANRIAAEGGVGAFDSAGQLVRNGSRPLQAQIANNTCGPNSVSMILETVRPGRSATTLFNLNLGPGGTTIDRLAVMLNRNGVGATWRAGYSIDDIAAATARGNPLIAHVKVPNYTGHFVVVDGVTTRLGQRVVAIRDPLGGRQYFELTSEFSKRFSGQVVTLP